MRYLLIRSPDKDEVLAFTSFMLTPEDDNPVIYIYEIHLSAALHGSGIGKRLMQIVEDAGRMVGVKMCMLTVFSSNERAETFYRRLGYTEDASSAKARVLRHGKIKKPEFWILSKSLDGDKRT